MLWCWVESDRYWNSRLCILILVLPILLGLLYLAIQCCFCYATSLRSTRQSIEFKYTHLLFLKILLYRVSHLYKYHIVTFIFWGNYYTYLLGITQRNRVWFVYEQCTLFFVTIFKIPPIHTPLNNANTLIFVDMVLCFGCFSWFF